MKLAKPWLVAYLGALAVLLAASALHPAGLRKHRALEAEVRRVAEENETLRERNVRLRREARALAGDPAALERAAREELGYVRPGERVYELPPAGEPR
ncbi:MAG TPA: septum formation initiator family protein [Anaeromyxobacteraceae bacterium]|nr:septum formation initiator family protein [Anaeromyxobacteraceae bacterium]